MALCHLFYYKYLFQINYFKLCPVTLVLHVLKAIGALVSVWLGKTFFQSV